jgi:hypothetical protein
MKAWDKLIGKIMEATGVDHRTAEELVRLRTATWLTGNWWASDGEPPWMGYTHIIRSALDPQRSPRSKEGAEARWAESMSFTKGKGPKVAQKKAQYRRQIKKLMADGRPRTLNAIGVELWDKTADILFQGPVDQVLWSLVESEELEHTMQAPIFFRKKS